MLTPTPAFQFRQKLIQRLRASDAQQHILSLGEWFSPNAPVCFIGMGLRLLHEEGVLTSTHYADIVHERLLADRLNIPLTRLYEYVVYNDTYHLSFNELAAKLEEEPFSSSCFSVS